MASRRQGGSIDRGDQTTLAIILGLTLAAAVGLGLLAGHFGWPAFAAVGAVLAASAVLYSPFLGLVLLTFTIPLENALMVAEGVTSGRLIGMAVLGAWLLRKVATRESWGGVLSSGFLVAAVPFACLALASMFWARDPMLARSGFVSLMQMIAFALIFIDLAGTPKRLDTIAKTLVLSGVVAASLTVYQFEALGLRRAGADVSGGINATAILMVTLVPLGFYLLRAGNRFGWRLLGFLFVPLASLAVIMTFSRFNLMLLPVTVGLCVLLALPERRARKWLVAMAALAGASAAFLVPWEKLEERADSISPYVTETLQFGQEREVTSARGYHLRVGLAIMRDHPILGVGYGNYGVYFLEEYQFRVSGADRLYGSRRDPHSTYLGVLADLGVVGLALWLLILIVSVRGIQRAWKVCRASGNRRNLALVQAAAVILGLHVLGYGWYTQSQYEKMFWLILGVCVSLGITMSRCLGGDDPEFFGEI